MEIIVTDWAGGTNLKGTGYTQSQPVEGNADDAFRIARELYDRGLNVMIRRRPSYNSGTRKNPVIEPELLFVMVDTERFQQR